jgi:hypothetical protein
MPPLLGIEASQIFGQRGALGVRQRPQMPGLRWRHIVRFLPCVTCLQGRPTSISGIIAALRLPPKLTMRPKAKTS